MLTHSHTVDGPATPKAIAATHVLNLTVTLRRKEKAAVTLSIDLIHCYFSKIWQNLPIDAVVDAEL